MHVEVTDNLVGTVVEMLGVRRGRMIDMSSENGMTFMRFLVPTRGLLGFRSKFLTATSGNGQLHSIFYGYEPMAGPVPRRQFGSLIAYEAGAATTYAMLDVQQRGTYFIAPGDEVYEGMVVGEHIRPEDLAVNLCRTKQLSAVHTKTYFEEERMRGVRNMSLDDYLEFIADDELLEVTPVSLRPRKKTLNNELRMREVKRREKMMAEQ